MCVAVGGSRLLHPSRLQVGISSDPGVLEDVGQGDPVLGALLQEFGDEVDGRGADAGVRGELEVHLEDAAVGLAVADGLKGRHSKEELVGEDSQAPEVHEAVVRLPLNHLGREVVQGSAQGLAAVVGRVDGPAKVANLELPVEANQEILRLDVAVDDVL